MTVTPPSIDDVLAALAEPRRRHVLDRLAAHGEATATVLTGELPVSRQAIVQHLAVLDQAGLVTSLRVGRERRYRVRPESLRATAAWMVQAAAAWDTRLDAIRQLAETPADPDPDESTSVR